VSEDDSREEEEEEELQEDEDDDQAGGPGGMGCSPPPSLQVRVFCCDPLLYQLRPVFVVVAPEDMVVDIALS